MKENNCFIPVLSSCHLMHTFVNLFFQNLLNWINHIYFKKNLHLKTEWIYKSFILPHSCKIKHWHCPCLHDILHVCSAQWFKGGRGWLTHLINDLAACRTALATSTLLIPKLFFSSKCSLVLECHDNSLGKGSLDSLGPNSEIWKETMMVRIL